MSRRCRGSNDPATRNGGADGFSPREWFQSDIAYHGEANATLLRPAGTISGPCDVAYDSSHNLVATMQIARAPAAQTLPGGIQQLLSGAAPRVTIKGGRFNVQGTAMSTNSVTSLRVALADGELRSADRNWMTGRSHSQTPSANPTFSVTIVTETLEFHSQSPAVPYVLRASPGQF